MYVGPLFHLFNYCTGCVSVCNIDIPSVTNDLDRHYVMYLSQFDLERHHIVNCGLPYVIGILTWTDIMLFIFPWTDIFPYLLTWTDYKA